MNDKSLWEQFKSNRFERNGTLLLLGVVLIILFLSKFVLTQDIQTMKTHPDLSKIAQNHQRQLAESEALRIKEEQRTIKGRQSNSSIKKRTPKPIQNTKQNVRQVFHFDPNLIEYDSLLMLGFSSKVANTLIKFRSGGFGFSKPKDLFKIYGIDSNLVRKLQPYISIKRNEEEKFNQLELASNSEDTLWTAENLDEVVTSNVKIELNQATQKDLIQIHGIGPVYSSIITEYRKRLGGYYSFDQIEEAYEFPDSTMTILRNALELDTSYISKLNVNTTTFKELLAHPYISYEDTKILYPYLEARRPWQNLKELDNIMVLDKDVLKKILPYLSCGLTTQTPL